MLKITVKTVFDEDSSPRDWLGEFSEYYRDGAIKTESHLLPYHMQRDMWFVPGNSQQDQQNWYSKHGYSRHEAYTKARKHIYEDRQRYLDWLNDQWWFMGYVVTAYVNGVEVGSASLWGIESDSDKDSKQEIINDLTSEALAEAQATIDNLSSESIDWNEYEVTEL